MKKKIALITGASSGIGRDAALLLQEKGYQVVAAARRIDKLEELQSAGVEPMAVDVTDEVSLTQGVQTLLKKYGQIDILINNAGYGSYGAFEDVSQAEAKRQFEVNIFGLARLTQLVLPSMRQNHYGKIINISSIGGKMYAPFGSWYHATKFALEGLSDSLRNEVAPFGIDVVVVEPGAIKTEWSGIAAENLLKVSGKTAYASMAQKLYSVMSGATHSRFQSEPRVISRVILKAIEAKKPKTRYATGAGASLFLTLRKLLSDRQFDWVMNRILSLN